MKLLTVQFSALDAGIFFKRRDIAGFWIGNDGVETMCRALRGRVMDSQM